MSLGLNGWRTLRGESSLASYLACIGECISERERRKIEKGLDYKVKLVCVWEEGRIQEVIAWRK